MENNRNNDSFDNGAIYESTRNISHRENSPRPRKKQPTQNNLATFYVIALVIAIVLCMIIFFVVFQAITGSRPRETTPLEAGVPAITPSVVISDLPEITGVIRIIDPGAARMEIFNVETSASYSLVLREDTNYLDQSGRPLVLSEFAVGEIIDTRFNRETTVAHEIRKSSNAWTYRERQNIRIDTSARTMTIGNDRYSYDDNLVTLYNGRRFSIDHLIPRDIITISGVGQMVWSVVLIQGHGTLHITNSSHITNGVVEIGGTDIYQSLEDTTTLHLPQGTYNLVIKGDNIEPYMRNITVETNQSQHVNLSGIRLRTGWLSVQVNTQDYQLFINNEERQSGIPVNLTFGQYTIRVEKEGYITAEQTVTLNELSLGVTMELRPVMRLGRITVTSNPPGARVFVDNAHIGDTPITRSFELGPRTLMITKDGFISITMPINIDQDAEPYNYYNFELQPMPIITPGIPTDMPLPTPEPPQNNGNFWGIGD